MTQDNLNLDEYFYSPDLALVGAISLYFPIESIDRSQNPNKVQFLFRKKPELEKLIDAYWRGELKVEPQRYFNQLKNIKARLYAERR